MAEDRITYEELVNSKQLLSSWEKDFKKMESVAKKSLSNIKKDAGALFKGVKSTADIQRDVEKLKKLVNDLTATKKAQEQVDKGLYNIEVKRQALQKQEAQLLANQKEEVRKLTREKQLKAKAETAEANSINKLKAENNKLVSELHKLNLATDKGRKQAKQYQRQIMANEKQLKKFDAAIGRHQRNVGNYASALKNVGRQLLGAAGLLSGVMLVTSAFKRATRVNLDFNKSLASLSAITGVTGKELEAFAEAAKNASRKTLQGAADMLKAYERVGSIRPELLKSRDALIAVTDAAVILSESTGGMLSMEDAANAAAGAMNQFGIDSSEAIRVVNTLAAGSKFGSATTVQLSEAFKNFGAVANAANISLEQSVGLVELAATKMIVGAEAGTAIRGSILRLQAANLGYTSGQFKVNDAIDEFNAKMETFGTQAEKDAYKVKVFGQRNVIFGTILTENKEKFNELTEAVTGTNTALEQQDIQNSTVAGSLTKLSNAWDTLITGSSATADAIRGVVDAFTELINLMSGEGYQQTVQMDINGEIQEVALTWAEHAKLNAAIIYKEWLGLDAAYEKIVNNLQTKWKQNTVEDWGIYTDLQKLTAPDTFSWENLAPPPQLPGMSGDEKTEEETSDKIYRIRLNMLESLTGAERTAMEQRLSIKEEEATAEIALRNAVKDETIRLQNEIANSRTMKMREFGEMSEEAALEELELQEDIGEAKKELAYNSLAAGFDIFRSFKQREINALERQREYELSLAEGNAQEQERINEEYDAKVNEQRRKQDRAAKVQSLFDVAINTAVGITKTIGTVGMPAAIPLVVLTAALGAIQAAAIAARPLPQYAKGTKSAPEGWSVVGEDGNEMLVSPSGEISMTGDRAEVRYLEEGTEVVPNRELQKRLAGLTDRRLTRYNDKLTMKKMEDLQKQQLKKTDRTNELLGKFKYNIGKKVYDLNGNIEQRV